MRSASSLAIALALALALGPVACGSGDGGALPLDDGTSGEPGAGADAGAPAVQDAGAQPTTDAGTGADAGLPPRPLVVASTKELGVLTKPSHVVGRDGGPSCATGGKVLWTFGDTLLSPPASDGSTFRTNTAALASPSTPTTMSEPLDASGAPLQFVPFTAAEQAYNASKGNVGDDRYALWTNTLLPDGNGGCLVFFSRLHVGSGQLNYTNEGAGIARVKGPSTTAVRDPDLLFSPTDPALTATMSDGGFVYAYLSLAANKGIVVGRAPFASAGVRAAYAFWDGTSWQPDATKGEPVGISFLSSLSVTYNAYLRQYLAVGSVIFSADVVMLTAPRPEGPWTGGKAFTGMAPASGTTDYAAIEHPELDTGGGQSVRITYYHPTGTFTGELRLAEITLK